MNLVKLVLLPLSTMSQRMLWESGNRAQQVTEGGTTKQPCFYLEGRARSWRQRQKDALSPCVGTEIWRVNPLGTAAVAQESELQFQESGIQRKKTENRSHLLSLLLWHQQHFCRSILSWLPSIGTRLGWQIPPGRGVMCWNSNQTRAWWHCLLSLLLHAVLTAAAIETAILLASQSQKQKDPLVFFSTALIFNKHTEKQNSFKA